MNRNERNRIAAEIRALLDARAPGKTICPSEIARRLDPTQASTAGWQAWMPSVRAVAGELSRAGEVIVTQRGRSVDARTARGPVRIGKPCDGDDG